MNKEIIINLKEMMDAKAKEIGLKVHLGDEGSFIQIQLLDNNNRLIYMAYNVSEIISFIHGIQSDYKYHYSK